MPDQLEQLKQKYQSVIDTAKQLGVQLQHVNMSGQKLYIQGVAPSEDAKNKVWDRIKQVDSAYSDLTVDFSVSQTQTAQAAAGGGQEQSRSYTIQPGDTLSGISQRFYGKASEYAKILDANRDKIKDADHIRAGDTITIP